MTSKRAESGPSVRLIGFKLVSNSFLSTYAVRCSLRSTCEHKNGQHGNSFTYKGGDKAFLGHGDVGDLLHHFHFVSDSAEVVDVDGPLHAEVVRQRLVEVLSVVADLLLSACIDFSFKQDPIDLVQNCEALSDFLKLDSPKWQFDQVNICFVHGLFECIKIPGQLQKFKYLRLNIGLLVGIHSRFSPSRARGHYSGSLEYLDDFELSLARCVHFLLFSFNVAYDKITILRLEVVSLCPCIISKLRKPLLELSDAVDRVEEVEELDLQA